MINRDNYETYLLLYTDNELSQPEREAVERFIEQNPDLKGELDLFGQTKLASPAFAFADKASLFKKEEGISLQNFQEYFLLSVDNELTVQQQESVQNFVLTHPQLQQAFTELQDSKLVAPAIAHPAKQELYRSEKTRRIIPFAWFRVGVAAAVLAVVVTTVVLTNSPSVDTSVAVNTTDKPAIKTPAKKPDVTVTQAPVAALDQQKQKPKPTEPLGRPTKKAILQKEQLAAPEVLAKNTAAIENKKQVDIETPVAKAPQKNMNNLPQVVAIEEHKNNDSPVPAVASPDIVQVAKNSNEQVQAVQTVYREIDTEQDEEDRNLYIGSTEINKTKLIGLFKRAKSLFDKKGKNEKTLQVTTSQQKS